MAFIEPKKNVQTFVGNASIIESDQPLDTSGVGGVVAVRICEDGNREQKVFVHTTGDYRPEANHTNYSRGWQVALNKDQALCLAREILKMAGEL